MLPTRVMCMRRSVAVFWEQFRSFAILSFVTKLEIKFIFVQQALHAPHVLHMPENEYAESILPLVACASVTGKR